MATLEMIVNFSNKSESVIKQEIETEIQSQSDKNEAFKNASDGDKITVVMNSLFNKYSKASFGSDSAKILAFRIGDYGRRDQVSYTRKIIGEQVADNPENAEAMNMIDSEGNYRYYSTQAEFTKDNISYDHTKGQECLNWKGIKKFEELNLADINNMPEGPAKNKMLITYDKANLVHNGMKYIGKYVPLNHFQLFEHGFELVEGKWLRYCRKSEHVVPSPADKETKIQEFDNTLLVPDAYNLGEFPIFKVDFMSKNGLNYYVDSGKYQFDLKKAMSDKEIEGIIDTLEITRLNTIKTVVNTCNNTQYKLFKCNVHSIIPIKDKFMLKVYDDSMALCEKDENNNRIVPITVFCVEGYKPDFGDNAEICIFGKAKQKPNGPISIEACGIYVSQLYKSLVPEVQDIEL